MTEARATAPLGLFAGYGIEIEYMIVDRSTLCVAPLSDRVLHHIAGSYESEVEMGALSWSNELVLHVLEFKTNGPAASLEPLAGAFHDDVVRANTILADHGACLMPTAMHPMMDPESETRLWPHEYQDVYEAFNRIFDCRGHGWSNLQSVHINLPFDGDEEFGRLHAAIRMVLPILPALAASSPIVAGVPTGYRDTRLEYYRKNCRRVPSVTGHVVPEPVFTRADYQNMLDGLYSDIRPFDPDGVLQHEWLNARGAIARFDRDAIEIRLLDVQESPRADLAVAAAVIGVVRGLTAEATSRFEQQRAWPAERLEAILLETIRSGSSSEITDTEYLADMGMETDGPLEAGALWRHWLERLDGQLPTGASGALECILNEGCLAERILRATRGESSRIAPVYRHLTDCLAGNLLFHPASV
jgi:gamma-glutamyl:cysteine ligase YbdK (ATP-grasp superfamily)